MKNRGHHGWPDLGFRIEHGSPSCHGSGTHKVDSSEDGSKLDSEQLPSPNQRIDLYQDQLWALALTMQT